MRVRKWPFLRLYLPFRPGHGQAAAVTAIRKLGEVSADLEWAKVRGNQHTGKVRASDTTKTATLASIGVTRQRANEAEKLAWIDEGVFKQHSSGSYFNLNV